ncbi:ATP-binding cassette domain-containing protein [Olsenella profusa]|uniref:ATP-binding cassette domain-containing protein n=1 Tax=Olsenella profusa TaxID=138595 RepID=A0ABS2F190_9ACTN|nr:ATP-binding cassette domain-containing protein [Olsenella profusa]
MRRLIEVRDVRFAYAGRTPALDGVSLAVRPGERVVLLGVNGSGKSTLGRLLNGGLAPASGSVSVDGEKNPRLLVRLVGYVRQDPRNQIVSALVSDEVAFGPRNLGLTRDEVLERVGWALGQCGIADLRDRLTTELSGGQQQLLAIAGVLAMRPRYLVLDEVGAHLDEASRERVRAVVRTLVAEGVGVVEVAHGPQDLFGASRALVLRAGELAWEGAPEELLSSEEALGALDWRGDALTEALRGAVRAGHALGARPDVDALAAHLPAPASKPVPPAASGAVPPCLAPEPPMLALSRVRVDYEGLVALDDVTLSASGLTLVLGASGSGKTTAARVLAGVLRPDAGQAELNGAPVRAGQVGLVFQRPEDQLFCDTVLDELAYGPRAAGAPAEVAERRAREVACELGLADGLLSRSPFELSGGQMRRVALAAVVAARPAAFVFDEPTAGLDAPARRQLRALVHTLVDSGAPVVVITHDAGDWLAEADDVYLLASGHVVAHEDAGLVARSPELFERAGLTPPLTVRLRARQEASLHA